MGQRGFNQISTKTPWGYRMLALLIVATVLLGSTGLRSHAAETKSITLGESLNEEQRQELLTYFEATEDDTITVVTLAETREAMTGIIDPDAKETRISSAYSSTALTCRELGEGLDVTTHNITLISPALYAAALATAGIGDVELKVAAPNDAPAQGTAALTGVFKTWAVSPCPSGQTTPERQKLAMEELALAVEIGQALYAQGVDNSMVIGGEIILQTQRAVVTDGLTDPSQVADVVAEQEMNLGVQLPKELRDKTVDLMSRIAGASIDWSTYSAGWTIEFNDDRSAITMRGEGIAIRNAQASATAAAEASATAAAIAQATADADATAAANAAATAAAEAANAAATASAEAANATATAEANAAATEAAHAAETATAEAEQTAAADANAAMTATVRVAAEQTAAAEADADDALTATAAAHAALTATAQAAPTQTPTPSPTAVAGTFTVAGTVNGGDGTSLTIQPAGSDDHVVYHYQPNVTVTRDGAAASMADLAAGDEVTLIIDAGSRQIVRVEAAAPVAAGGFPWYLALLPIILVAVILLLLRRRSAAEEPFIVRRAAQHKPAVSGD